MKNMKEDVYVVLSYNKEYIDELKDKLNQLNIETGDYYLGLINCNSKIGMILYKYFKQRNEKTNKRR